MSKVGWDANQQPNDIGYRVSTCNARQYGFWFLTSCFCITISNFRSSGWNRKSWSKLAFVSLELPIREVVQGMSFIHETLQNTRSLTWYWWLKQNQHSHAFPHVVSKWRKNKWSDNHIQTHFCFEMYLFREHKQVGPNRTKHDEEDGVLHNTSFMFFGLFLWC